MPPPSEQSLRTNCGGRTHFIFPPSAMPSSDLGHDSSESDNDDALLADIHALSKACFHTAPRDASDDCAAGGAFEDAAPGDAAADSSEPDGDLEFLRDVRQKYGDADGADPGRSDSDDDEDFEILEAIKRRFGQYSASGRNSVGVGDSQGMLSNRDSELNLPVHEMFNAEVSDRFDRYDEGLCDSASNDDEVEKQRYENSDLPKSALAFIDAIKKNRLAQKHIRNQMMSVEAKMEKVKEMIKRVKVIYEFDVHERKKMARRRQDDRVQLISVPSKDSKKVPSAMKHGPPENSRVANYRIAFNQYPQWITKERWTKEDQINLRNGVVQQFQKCLLLKSMDRMDESEGHECANGVDEIISQIGDFQDPHTIKSFLPNVDWEELASTYLPKRSGPECRTRWINFEDPLINNEKWTRLEDKSLLDFVQQLGYNWVAVAEFIGTNRTPYQCLVRYQRSLNRSLMNREWTSAQDAELTAAVQTYGESNWTVVASVLEGRSGPQCSNRWLKTLLPSKQRKGRWNSEEDKRLKIAVMIMGSKCWNKIAEFVPGRTQARCRERWMNNLDPSLNLGKWTADEDAKLEEAIRVHGYCWAKIATCVPPRTDNQCRRRWTVLFPDEALRVTAERKAVRDALPSNFVDREPNRPTLEANDFTPLLLGCTEEVKKPSRRKKLNKVSDTAFCNFPKKGRSRRCRRMEIRWEYPLIHQTLPSKRRIRQKKSTEADLTLADIKKSVKGAGKKRKRRENEIISRCKNVDADPKPIKTYYRKRFRGSQMQVMSCVL